MNSIDTIFSRVRENIIPVYSHEEDIDDINKVYFTIGIQIILLLLKIDANNIKLDKLSTLKEDIDEILKDRYLSKYRKNLSEDQNINDFINLEDYN
jgi:hypothetical protein